MALKSNWETKLFKTFVGIGPEEEIDYEIHGQRAKAEMSNPIDNVSVKALISQKYSKKYGPGRTDVLKLTSIPLDDTITPNIEVVTLLNPSYISPYRINCSSLNRGNCRNVHCTIYPSDLVIYDSSDIEPLKNPDRIKIALGLQALSKKMLVDNSNVFQKVIETKREGFVIPSDLIGYKNMWMYFWYDPNSNLLTFGRELGQNTKGKNYFRMGIVTDDGNYNLDEVLPPLEYQMNSLEQII